MLEKEIMKPLFQRPQVESKELLRRAYITKDQRLNFNQFLKNSSENKVSKIIILARLLDLAFYQRINYKLIFKMDPRVVKFGAARGRRRSKVINLKQYNNIFNQDANDFRIVDSDPAVLQRIRITVADNRVKTSRYTWWWFLPKNLFEQYSKASNIYFLVIMIMQMIDVISISDGKPAMLPPMIFVIVTSMLKDGYEDYKRHRDDKAENEELTEVFNQVSGQFQIVHWQNVQVGDVVRVKRNQYFPADMLLMHSSGENGVCFVETKNLDGESNLKMKTAAKEMNRIYKEEADVTHLQGIIGCEVPNNQIYKFDGTLCIPFNQDNVSEHTQHSNVSNKDQVPVSNDNIVLRGMSLRNTEEIYGWVLYTGHETKIYMNSAKPAYKTSTVMRITYKAIISIFVAQAILGALASVLGSYWQTENIDNATYLDLIDADKWNQNFWLLSIKMLGTWMLIMTNCVPISLLVSLEVIKLWQGSFMAWDVLMYDMNQDLPMKPRDTSINEELGQVEYIFSDKTGTLTCNVMQFKKFSAGLYSYYACDTSEDEDFESTFPSKRGIDTTSARLIPSNELLQRSLGFDPITEKQIEDKAGDFVKQRSFSGKSSLMQSRDQHDNPVTSETQEIPLQFGKARSVIADKNHPEFKNVSDVLLHLALCHTVIIDQSKNEYNSSSPDELALVEGAKSLGFEFLNKDYNHVIEVQVPAWGYTMTRKFQVLNVLEFNSTRKRMSVIVQDIDEKKILLLTKGADSVIEGLLDLTKEENQVMLQVTKKHVEAAAIEGLRTLFMAKKELTQEAYDEWNKKFTEAATSIKNREERLEAINAQIELDLVLVGSSAIEDKLQTEVAETLQALKSAGIKIWVLTGDKVETAINIGYSAGLLDKDMDTMKIEGTDTEDIKDCLRDISDEMKRIGRQALALIVCGDTLLIIQNDPLIAEEFMRLATEAEVIIACRVSPKQKGDVVTMVKQKFPFKTTLAIGDGANDVAMINMADVGVGIAGREGMQAARSSDFAIGQFKFLKPLLFIHGREAYRRNTEVVCYSFYKNILYIMAQYWFGFASVFSGQPLYEPFIYQMYNMHMTGIPIVFYSVFDFQYTKSAFMRTPQYYKLGFDHKFFNFRVFWWWIAYAMLYCGLMNVFCIYVPSMSDSKEGKGFGLWACGHTVLACSVILCNLKMLMMFNVWTGWGEVLVLLSIASFYVNLYVEAQMPAFPQLYGIWEEFTTNPQAWLGLLFVVSGIITLDVMCNVVWNAIMYILQQRKDILNEDQIALKMCKCSCESNRIDRIRDSGSIENRNAFEVMQQIELTETVKTHIN